MTVAGQMLPLVQPHTLPHDCIWMLDACWIWTSGLAFGISVPLTTNASFKPVGFTVQTMELMFMK